MEKFPKFEKKKPNFTVEGGEITIDGEKFRRIPFGEESGYEGESKCHDCGEEKGSLHSVADKPHDDLSADMIFCDMEECPRCHEQLMSCPCLNNPEDGKLFEDEDEEPPDLGLN